MAANPADIAILPAVPRRNFIRDALRRHPTAIIGGFLFKDVALLGVSVWTLADAVRAVRQS